MKKRTIILATVLAVLVIILLIVSITKNEERLEGPGAEDIENGSVNQNVAL